MSAASSSSSSLISIATCSNSLCNSKTLNLISISKTHFKTPKLSSLNLKTPHSFNFQPLIRSSLPPFNSIQLDQTPQSEPSPIAEELELEIDDDEDAKYDDEDEDDEEEEEVESEAESPEAGRLYIGNLPYAITSSELSQVFGEAGNVVSVEIVYDRVTDRSRGFAFITMATVQEATEAIRMFNGSQIGGRTVKVNFPEVPRGGEREVMGPKIRSSNRDFIESPHKIYAGNLSWIMTSEKLKDAFVDHPGLLSAKVIYEKQSGRSRGFGFVTFSSAEAAESALSAMNGKEIEGRPLRLNLAGDGSRSGRSSETSVDGSEILSSSFSS